MLLDIQNRGQLSAGMTTFNPERNQLIDTYKELGGVSEVFRLSHRGKCESLMNEYSGRAAIGHVRYATCGAEDRSYAQPFERIICSGTNGSALPSTGNWPIISSCARLADRWRQSPGPRDRYRNHDARDQPRVVGRSSTALVDMWRNVDRRLDGAYSLVFLNAVGDMLIVRDPLGIKPLCYAMEGPLFAAASESVAL